MTRICCTKQFVSGYLGQAVLWNKVSAFRWDKPLYKTRWQSFVGTSHSC